MKIRKDTFVCHIAALTRGGSEEISLKQPMSLAALQDMIGTIIETMPAASSFAVMIVRRVTYTEEDSV